MISTVQRLPKWLLQERFEISFLPSKPPPMFEVKLYRKGAGTNEPPAYSGCGTSICHAAKEARAMRELP